MEETKQEVAEMKNTEVATNDVSQMDGFEEGIDMSEIKPPRVKLVQGSSAEAKDPESDIRPGWLINNITSEVYKQPLKFIPLTKVTTFIRWNPKKDTDYGYDPSYQPGQLIYIKNNKAECGKEADFVDGKPPLAKKYINFLCYLPDYPDFPTIISFGKTSCKIGENLVNTLFLKGRSMYESTFELSVKTEEKNDDQYFVLATKYVGNTEGINLSTAKAFHGQFAKSVQSHVHQEAEQAPWT